MVSLKYHLGKYWYWKIWNIWWKSLLFSIKRNLEKRCHCVLLCGCSFNIIYKNTVSQSEHTSKFIAYFACFHSKSKVHIQHIIFSSTCLALTDVFSPGREGAKDVYQAVHQITPHIHMMWFDTIFIPSLSNHASYYVHHIHIYAQYKNVHTNSI